MKILLVDDVREPQYILDLDHPEFESQHYGPRKYINDPSLGHEIEIAKNGHLYRLQGKSANKILNDMKMLRVPKLERKWELRLKFPTERL